MTSDRGHILLSADVVGLTFLCFGRSVVVTADISQGTAATPLRCDGICGVSYAQISC